MILPLLLFLSACAGNETSTEYGNESQEATTQEESREPSSEENVINSATEYQGPNPQFGEAIEAEKETLYINEKYKFSLEVPDTWSGKYIVRTVSNHTHTWVREPAEIIAFSMIEDGKYMGDLFSLAIIEGISPEEAQAHYADGAGFEDFLASNGEIVLIYSIPAELPISLYEEPYVQVGEEFGRMLQEDVPIILQSVSFFNE